MSLQRTTFEHFDNIWLGTAISPVSDLFYRYRRHQTYEYRRSNNIKGLEFEFFFSQEQMILVRTSYSVLEFLSAAAAFILFLESMFVPFAISISQVTFKLGAITELYQAKVKRRRFNSSTSVDNVTMKTEMLDGRDFGRVNLTTIQYLRLMCAVNNPCCFSPKKKEIRPLDSEDTTINEGGHSEH